MAQCAAHLAQLQTRLATCQAELATTQDQLQAACDQYRLAVWKDDALRTGPAHDQMAHAQHQIQELTALTTLLHDGIQNAEHALAGARARRQEAETAHWMTIRAQLSDDFEHYCCQLLTHRAGLPPTTPSAVLQRLGPLGVSQVRMATCQRLREQYPFVEEEPIHA